MRSLAILIVFTLVSAPAQDHLRLTEVTRLALSRNPDLQAARQIVAEAAARAGGSGRLSNPEFETEAAAGAGFEGRVEVALTQWFPVTSRLRREKEFSALQIAMAKEEVANQERKIVAEAMTAWVELAAAEEEQSLVVSQVRTFDEQTKSFETQATEGLVSSLDAESSRLAGHEIRFRQVELEVQEKSASARLATLIGRPATTVLRAGPLAISKSPPARASTLNRPDLRLAQLAVESGDAEILLARASRWEDIGVGVFAEGERNREDSGAIEPESFFGMRVNIPLPIWQDGSARVKEKQSARQRLEQELAARTLAVENEVSVAWQTMKIRFDAASRVGAKALPDGRRYLAETIAARERGEIDLAQVFRARERLMALERAELEARKAFHLARIQWLAATGRILFEP